MCDVNENGISGTCMKMCPEEERILREREGLLHRFEVYDYGLTKGRPKSDPEKTVKCFSRSAAGLSTPRPSILRPGPVLLHTVRYLMKNIAPLIDNRPLDVFDFITDRLRAIRQDMTIQRLKPDVCILLLEPMIRFHVLYGYLLATHSRFDHHLNDVHLQECLMTVLKCYQVSPDSGSNRTSIKTIFMCTNITRPESVVEKLKNCEVTGEKLQILCAWVSKNYIKLLNLGTKLELLPRAAFSLHLPYLRSNALTTLCHAMSSSNSVYSLHRLASLLSYNSVADALVDCHRLGIRVSEFDCHFSKKNLLPIPSPVTPQRWWAVDEELSSVDIAEMLLGL